MPEVQTGRGSGSTINISEQQELQAQQLAQSALEKGRGSIISTNLDPNVFNRASFLLANQRARSYQAIVSSAETRARQSLPDVRASAAEDVFKSQQQLQTEAGVRSQLLRRPDGTIIQKPSTIYQDNKTPSGANIPIQGNQSVAPTLFSPAPVGSLEQRNISRGVREIRRQRQREQIVSSVESASLGLFESFKKTPSGRTISETAQIVSKGLKKPVRYGEVPSPYQTDQTMQSFAPTISPRQTNVIGLAEDVFVRPVERLSKKTGDLFYESEKGVLLIEKKGKAEVSSRIRKQSIVPEGISPTQEIFLGSRRRTRELGVDIGSYFTPLVGTGRVITEGGRGLVTATDRTQSPVNRIFGGIQAGLVGGAGLFFGARKGLRYLDEPVEVGTISKAETKTIALVGQKGDIGAADILYTSTPEIRAYAPRSTVYIQRANIFRKKPIETNNKAVLESIYGDKLTLTEIKKPQAGRIIIDPFKIEEGKIVRPADPTKSYLYGTSFRTTPSGRLAKPEVFVLGTTTRRESIGLGTAEFQKLSKQERQLVQTMLRRQERLDANIGIADTLTYSPTRKLGKRTTRSESAIIEDAQISFPTGAELITGRTTSRAQKVSPLGRPKKETIGTFLLKKEPAPVTKESESVGSVIFGRKGKSQSTDVKTITKESIASLVSSATTQIRKIPTKISKPVQKATSVTRQATDSIYAGLGLYERTEEQPAQAITTPKSQVRGTLVGGDFNYLGYRSATTQTNTTSFGISPRLSAVNISGLSNIQGASLIQAPSTRERGNQGTISRAATRTVTRQRLRTQSQTARGFFSSFASPRFNRPQTTETPTKIIVGRLRDDEEEDRKQRGYIAEAKIGGRFVTITSKAVSKQKALSIGSQFTDTTLARTFRIVPTRQKVKAERRRSFVDLSKFRTFKQTRGQRTGLTNTFIEKAKFSLDPREQRIIQPLASRARRTRNRI